MTETHCVGLNHTLAPGHFIKVLGMLQTAAVSALLAFPVLLF